MNRMQQRRDAGLAAVHFFVDESNKKAWVEFAARYGRTLKDEIVLAMTRHLASPPPTPEDAPLPVELPKRRVGRPKKNS